MPERRQPYPFGDDINMTDASRTTPRRTSALTAAFLLGAAMVISGGALLLSPGAASAQASNISIVQTPAAVQGTCAPGTMGLSRVVTSTDAFFKLTITAAAPPCSPIDAVAVIYAMPGGAQQWPQTLAEKAPFTISQAGTTEITFTKGCNPVQFDVVTGATPQTIAPFGEWHGPLLFPLDIETSQQFFGNGGDCNENTTTTQATTTTTTTGATTTTTEATTTTTTSPPQVLGTTEVATTTTQPAVVLGETTTPTGSLAVTGFSSRDAALIGGGLVLMGAGLMVEARRRLR